MPASDHWIRGGRTPRCERTVQQLLWGRTVVTRRRAARWRAKPARAATTWSWAKAARTAASRGRAKAAGAALAHLFELLPLFGVQEFLQFGVDFFLKGVDFLFLLGSDRQALP